jgi:predicted small lipoprotein YifL
MLRDFIARIHRAAIGLAVAAAISIAPLTACGVKGPLKLPPPPSPAAGAPSSESPAAADAAPAAAPVPQPPEPKP